jgi:hypothetical protein
MAGVIYGTAAEAVPFHKTQFTRRGFMALVAASSQQ